MNCLRNSKNIFPETVADRKENLLQLMTKPIDEEHCNKDDKHINHRLQKKPMIDYFFLFFT